MNAIQAFVPPDVVKTFAAFLEFFYIARRNVISEDSLEQLRAALQRFHEARKVFLGTVREDGPSAFSLPRQHAMVHYYDQIKNFGSPNGLCSSITESKHITAVKRPWRRSNKHAALPQILRSNERIDKLTAARTDFTARGMLADSCLVQAFKAAVETMDCDEDSDAATSDSDNSDFDTELSNPNDLSTRTLDTITPALNDSSTRDLETRHSETDSPDNTDMDTSDPDNDFPPTPRPVSPMPSDDEDEDDCGPVESGPLMNEVRFMSKKG